MTVQRQPQDRPESVIRPLAPARGVNMQHARAVARVVSPNHSRVVARLISPNHSRAVATSA
jgi:hypothetical protein